MTNHSDASLPTHLGIIPDGNRRWARDNGLTALEGHKRGYDNLKTISEAVLDRGIQYATVFAFSTENWQRSPEEVKYLMDLLNWVLNRDVRHFHEKGIRLGFFGLREGVDAKILAGIDRAIELTAANTRGRLNICFNYGARADIVHAAKQLVAKGLKPDQIDEAAFESALTSAGNPPLDLVIRTSGEQRLSNFMLWEAAYAELYFAAVHWPDFDEKQLDSALSAYAERKRRFGQ